MFWVVERRFQPRVFQGVTVPNKTACGEVVESGKNGRISAKLKWHVNIKIPRLKTFTGNLGSKFKMYIGNSSPKMNMSVTYHHSFSYIPVVSMGLVNMGIFNES